MLKDIIRRRLKGTRMYFTQDTLSRADACATLREGENKCGNGATQIYQLGIISFRCNNERAFVIAADPN